MQTIKFNKQSKLVALTKIENSRNGNPQFIMTFKNGLTGKTRRDGGEAYAVCSNWVGKTLRFDWSCNNRGQTFITAFEVVD